MPCLQKGRSESLQPSSAVALGLQSCAAPACQMLVSSTFPLLGSGPWVVEIQFAKLCVCVRFFLSVALLYESPRRKPG